MILAKLKEQDPVLAASVNGMELMVSALLDFDLFILFSIDFEVLTQNIISI